jgi:guanine deaminase
MKKEFMKYAIDEAYIGINNNHGGPFGCVIVRNGNIIGKGHNCVLLKKDPTCHGEMEAIRDACRNLNTYDLSGCELYTTAQPCPMCMGAALWANIKKIYYGCNTKDTENIGFRDDIFYRFLDGEGDIADVTEFERDSCLELFADYSKDKNRKIY